jgi:hypothetical protein
MSKETKQDRIARNMFDQVSEHFHDLKTLESNPACKEMDVERWCQSFLKNCLGYTATSGYSIRAQEAKGKSRPDLIVLKNEKPVFVVEVKKLGFDLNKSDFRSGKIQLNEYLNLIGNVKWGMLTNGQEWKLFDFSQANFNGVEVCSFDIRSEDDAINTTKKHVEDICYDMVDFHEHSYSAEYWDECLKEALAFSPDTLAKAILSVDVVKYISKFVKGEHEYKASHDVLTDKVYDLLRLGLNDAIKGWNEAKAMDFEKYIKSQKRASNRNKKSRMPKSISETVSSESLSVPVAIGASALEDKKVG